MDLITGFTFRCLKCDTAITFNLSESLDGDATTKLSDAIDKLHCPVCGESLSVGASQVLDTVKKYNATVTLLRYYENNGNVDLLLG